MSLKGYLKRESGTDAGVGGYYTPDVSQPDTNTIQFAFTGSHKGMPSVPDVIIPLPSAQIAEAEKEEIVREVTNTVKTEVVTEVKTEIKEEVKTEVVKEETVTVITEEVLKQMNSQMAGIWAINKMAYGSPEMGHLSQDINFTSTIALYQTDEGLATIGSDDKLVSKHEVSCSHIEIGIDADAAIVQYTVESTDETFQAYLDEVGTNTVPVFMWMSILPSGSWSCSEAMIVDFGTAQSVAAEFKEAFEVLATQREETATTLKSVSITESADGTVTMVNTLSSGETETIVIGADANGNPNSLTYNGVEISFSYTKEEATETEANA